MNWKNYSFVSIHRVPHLRRFQAFEVPQTVCMSGALHLRYTANAYHTAL
jgi:hypothetical protein